MRFQKRAQSFAPVFLLALAAAAWLVLWLWGRSPHARYLDHAAAMFLEPSWVIAFVLGWLLMVVAMMLPSTLPLVQIFQRVTGKLRQRGVLLFLLVVGYLAVWLVFGVAVWLGDAALHGLVGGSALLAEQAWAFGAATFVLAGVYQFTPLKHQCLKRCRTPLSFVVGHWRGDRPGFRAFVLGAHHGLFCLGCCWTLMLLMFVVGMASLGWMLALAAVMTVEKTQPRVRFLGPLVGVVLIFAGTVMVWQAKPW